MTTSKPLTVAEAYELYLSDSSRNNVESTIATKRQRLAKFMRFQNVANHPVDEITAETINDWTVYSEKHLGMTGNVRCAIRNQIRFFYRWLEMQGHIAVNPLSLNRLTRIVKLQVRRPPITYEQHTALLAHWEANKERWKLWAYWPDACVVAWNTGLRLGDISCLGWDNVNFDTSIIHLMPQKTKRFEKRITVPMEPEVIETLNRRRIAQPVTERHESLLVFPRMAGVYRSPDRVMLCHQFRLACDRVGLPGELTFHSYRHAFISRLLNAGVNVKVIQSMTGQSLSVLYDYVTVTTDAQREAMAAARPKLGDKI